MKAIRKLQHGEGFVELCEIPVPEVKPNEVKIRVMSVGICGTDIKIRQDVAPSWPPVTLGHELSGVVEEVGSEVTTVKPGDRVVTETAQKICGKCYYCRTGDYLMCDDRRSIGYGVDGGMSEYCVVREDIIHLLPEKVDFDNGALCEPAAVAVHAVFDAATVKSTDFVLVSGCGAIGLLVAQVVKSFGATVIITGLTSDRLRLDVAKQLGIDYQVDLQKEDIAEVVKKVTNGRGVDLAYECSGALPAIKTNMSMLKKKGKMIQIGLTKPNLEIEYSLLTGRELSILGTFGHKWLSWETALQLINQGKIRTDLLITHRFPMSDWESAFAVAEKQEGIKVIIHPNDNQSL